MLGSLTVFPSVYSGFPTMSKSHPGPRETLRAEMAPDFLMHKQGSHVIGPLSLGMSLEACACITYRPFAKSIQVPKKKMLTD